MSQQRVAVIGAGPAGLMAALSAAEAGAKVVIYERLGRPGLKLLATGGGRCNLTNTLSPEDFMRAFSGRGEFMRQALRAFGSFELREFFSALGVSTRADDGLHVFPASERAGDVLAALLAACAARGVELQTSSAVASLRLDSGRVCGLKIASGDEPADAVVLACGGLGYPELGGSSSGRELAVQAGHNLTSAVPALCAVDTLDRWPGECAGLTLPDAELRLGDGKRAESRRGSLLFTHTGLSGPAALDLSGSVNAALSAGESPALALNPAARLDRAAWLAQFAEWTAAHPKKELGNLLPLRLPRALCRCLLAAFAPRCGRSGLDRLKPSELSRALREQLANFLVAVPLAPAPAPGFARAMATRGGVPLAEIDPRTLASRLAPGLYFAGEIVDLDGPCGGFNLQWAFSSGRLAGLSCATS